MSCITFIKVWVGLSKQESTNEAGAEAKLVQTMPCKKEKAKGNLQQVCQKEESPSQPRRQNVSGKVFSFAKYLLARLNRVSLTYLWQSEENLMINSLDHKIFPSMTNLGCCLGNGEGVDYKWTVRQGRIKNFVRLKLVWVGNGAKVLQEQSSRRSDGQPARTASVRFRHAISPTLFEEDCPPFRDCHSL